MDETTYSILVGTAGLDVAALLALLLTVARPPHEAGRQEKRRLMRLVALAIVLQGIHFSEELITGFHTAFPALLGLHPWPPAFFVPFNLFWIAVWALSLAGLRRPFRAAFFPLWFLGIASVVNGLAHPLFSAVTGGYFPGLWTAPFVGLAGVLLLRAMASSTRPG